MSSLQRLKARLERYWPKASLRTYLIAVILLATLPLAALISFQIFGAVRGEQAQIEDNLSRSAAALSQAVENELIASFDALTVLSYSELIKQGRLVQLERLLQEQPLPRRDWHSVFLLDRQGALLLDTASPQRGGLPGRELKDIHQNVLRKVQPAVSGLSETRGPGNQEVMLAVPVIQDGGVRYVLGARIGSPVWQRVANSASTPVGGHATLFDGRFQLLSSTPGMGISAGATLPADAVESMRGRPSGVHRSSALDGRTVYAAWNFVPLGGWSVRVSVPAAPIDAVHRQAIVAALTGSGASLLIGVLLAALAARRISRPLRQLATDGPSHLRGRIPVKEIAILRNALLWNAQQGESARRKLEAKAEEFETLFYNSPVGMAFAQDTNCAVVWHNAAMDQLLGPRSSISSGAVQLLRRGQPLPPGQKPLERAAALGEIALDQELEIAIDGRPSTFVIASAVPLRDLKGGPRGAICAFVDITARKRADAQLLAADQQLRANQHLMDLAQEAGHVGFLHYQFAGDRMAWTPGQCKLFGIAELDGSGLQAWFARIDENDRSRIEREFWTACALRRDKETLEYLVTRPDGSTHWLSSRVILNYDADGLAAQMIGVTVDMTEQQATEKARAQMTERALVARQEAEAASRAKDEFLTMLSHELRNPLGAISAASDVLEIAPPGGESAIEARVIIARQTRHLAHMLSDLLDVGRVVAGKILLTRQSFNLATVVTHVHQMLTLTGNVADHDLQLHLEEAWVHGDAVRIEQVVTNLITNALKYTPAGRRIEVSVERQQDCAVFEVRDCGMGIPAALLPHIFDLFVQGDLPLDRRAGGLGIGLTLARRLVELHDGTISAESSDDGSRFTVRLPAAPAPPRPQGDTLPPSRRRNVLVIEDNQDVLAALSSELELDGHTVSTAVDGIDGLTRLLELRPEVSIIDIGLPGLTGFALARHARAAGYAGRMIAISGYGHERDVKSALVAGFDAYLIKPVDRKQLRASLSTD